MAFILPSGSLIRGKVYSVNSSSTMKGYPTLRQAKEACTRRGLTARCGGGDSLEPRRRLVGKMQKAAIFDRPQAVLLMGTHSPLGLYKGHLIFCNCC